MNPRRQRVSVTTDASGDATVYSDHITGPVHMISYVKGNFTDGVDFTITLESTGESLWTDTNINASEKVYPVAVANLGSSGAASVLLQVPIVAANDRVKIIVGSGGNATTGAFVITSL